MAIAVVPLVLCCECFAIIAGQTCLFALFAHSFSGQDAAKEALVAVIAKVSPRKYSSIPTLRSPGCHILSELVSRRQDGKEIFSFENPSIFVS